MKKIRILQFPVSNSKGGITQYVLQNWEFIDKTKFQFDFATMSKQLSFADVLESDNCKIHYISCYAEDNSEVFTREFRTILKEGCYDVVHIHTKQWKSFVVEQIAKELGVKKVIVHAHATGIDTNDETKRKKEEALHNFILGQLTENLATDFWACSNTAADFIFASQISKQKIKIMNNAIDLLKYVYKPEIRQEYRKKLGISVDDFVIGNVGRFAYSKNHIFLIQVFNCLCKMNNKKYKLLLVGTGTKIEECIELVNKYNIKENVIFAGFRTDIPELLQVMDVFCMPSLFEGLPLALIEAQISGLPCIVSETVTNEAIIDENIIQLDFNLESWKNEIIKCSIKSYFRKSQVEKMAKAGYDIRKQIKRLEQEYLII